MYNPDLDSTSTVQFGIKGARGVLRTPAPVVDSLRSKDVVGISFAKTDPESSFSRMNNPERGIVKSKESLFKSDEDSSYEDSDDDLFLLPGEEYRGSPLHDVFYLCPYDGPIRGTLRVTNFQLFFRSRGKPVFRLEVPLGVISRVGKMGGARSSSSREFSYGIEVSCKNLRVLRFAHEQENRSRRTVMDILQQGAFPVTHELRFFAFDHFEASGPEFYGDNGWAVYSAMAEYERMGIPSNEWRLTTVNATYQVSDSYPSVWAVPNLHSVTDEFLRQVAAFRSRGRIPVLSWLHPKTKASITRSSQPLVGVFASRSVADQKYVECLKTVNCASHKGYPVLSGASAPSESKKFFILDARPSVNAIANKARGGGYEPVSEENYSFAELEFLGIQNIHVVRESLRKLQDVCFPGNEDGSDWLGAISSSGWLEHIKSILRGAVRVVELVETEGVSCLIHCADGWDRTAQLTSLAMLMMDPYYRTFKGFEVLVEKEWLSFGHKFGQRLGHGEDKPGDSDRSPIFVQFMDCVWQLTRQFPHVFEFNSDFLIVILDHMYSCLFGTFLYNNEMEREREGVKTKTHSLWSFLNRDLQPYRNPLFGVFDQDLTIVPQTVLWHIKVWKPYYCRWNPRTKLRDPMEERNVELLRIRDELLLRVLQSNPALLQSNPGESPQLCEMLRQLRTQREAGESQLMLPIQRRLRQRMPKPSPPESQQLMVSQQLMASQQSSQRKQRSPPGGDERVHQQSPPSSQQFRQRSPQGYQQASPQRNQQFLPSERTAQQSQLTSKPSPRGTQQLRPANQERRQELVQSESTASQRFPQRHQQFVDSEQVPLPPQLPPRNQQDRKHQQLLQWKEQQRQRNEQLLRSEPHGPEFVQPRDQQAAWPTEPRTLRRYQTDPTIQQFQQQPPPQRIQQLPAPHRPQHVPLLTQSPQRHLNQQLSQKELLGQQSPQKQPSQHRRRHEHDARRPRPTIERAGPVRVAPAVPSGVRAPAADSPHPPWTFDYHQDVSHRRIIGGATSDQDSHHLRL
ncbi:unnamed protein product [Cyprideis torosa]|uniref:phosphatidylinositol-3,5-bisphosphate 3-phosphatase n=1 Tax=Cyprideis torosa TaxID=163714 RepID=A0A7R8WJD2_9CRUS|nr:unnamed protein product [Cyprideis torosa]CAG0899028.1 unnamed protein product [Cyprideis torosa]